MNYPHQRENIKVCPGCGTYLIKTARHCVVCGYIFTEEDLQAIEDDENPPEQAGLVRLRDPGPGTPYQNLPRSDAPRSAAPRPRAPSLMPVTINLPVLLGLMILLLAANTLIILGFQKRDQTKALIAGGQVTATYLATIYVSPTPSATMTSTPAPPTLTPVVYIEYTVVSGDSCISIAHQFNLFVDSLLAKNDIDCANLAIGTVLRIPHPTATPEPTGTPAAPAAP
jgi:LysM repeat protein